MAALLIEEVFEDFGNASVLVKKFTKSKSSNKRGFLAVRFKYLFIRKAIICK